jgi:hypothetical protein
MDKPFEMRCRKKEGTAKTSVASSPKRPLTTSTSSTPLKLHVNMHWGAAAFFNNLTVDGNIFGASTGK